jgi:hypothetical protein
MTTHFNAQLPTSVTMHSRAAQDVDPWVHWRQGVVAAIRAAFRGVLDDIEEGDIDWEAWRSLYDEGRPPQAAVDRAFLRNM